MPSGQAGLWHTQIQQTALHADKAPAQRVFTASPLRETAEEKPAPSKDESFFKEPKRSLSEEDKQNQNLIPPKEQDTPTVMRIAKTAPSQNGQIQDEDMFKGSGAPTDQFDVPAYLRRRRGS